MTMFNNQQVQEIRELYAKGAKQIDLAKKYGTRQTNISKIVSGTTHRLAPGPITLMGRAKGERHPKCTISKEEVTDIRLLHELGYSFKEIAERMNVSQSQARAIALNLVRKDG